MHGRTPNAGPCLNAGARSMQCCSMQGRNVKAQCRAVCFMQGVRPMQGHTVNAGPCARCRAVRSMQGHVTNAGPYAQSRAARSVAGPCAQCGAVRAMHGCASNARRCAQCRGVDSMQGCTPIAGYVLCRAVRAVHGRALMQERTLCRGVRSMQGFVQCKPVRSMRSRARHAGPYTQRKGRTLNGRAVRSMEELHAQLQVVRADAGPWAHMQGRAFHAGLCAHCKKQGRSRSLQCPSRD